MNTIDALSYLPMKHYDGETWFFLDDGKVLVISRWYVGLYEDEEKALGEEALWERAL